jgi:hypothetical protein
VTVGELKSRLRTLEERLYRTGALVAEKPTPQRVLILRTTSERYEALAQRCYRLGIAQASGNSRPER